LVIPLLLIKSKEMEFVEVEMCRREREIDIERDTERVTENIYIFL